MRYKIVASFDNNSTDYLKSINYTLRKKLRLNRYNNNYHIEIISTSNMDLNVLNKVLSDILTPYKKFMVRIDDNICINANNRKINLKVLNKGYLSKITRNISDTLRLYGFKLNKCYDECDFYMTIFDFNRRNSHYINRLNNSFNLVKNTLKINKIEVLGINDKKELLVKSFPLREY